MYLEDLRIVSTSAALHRQSSLVIEEWLKKKVKE